MAATHDNRLIISNKAPRLPLGLILTAASITVGLIVWDSWLDQEESKRNAFEADCAARVVVVAEGMRRLNERLTMSARLAAVTGDKTWVDRYERDSAQLDRLTREAKSLAPTLAARKAAVSAEKARKYAKEIEAQAFDRLWGGRKDQAISLLSGPLYNRNSQDFSEATISFFKQLRAFDRATRDSEHFGEVLNRVAQGTIALALMVLWILGFRRLTRMWRSRTARYRDLVESFQLSEERQAKAHEFAESTIQCIFDIFYVFDKKGRFLRWNNALLTVTGYSEAELASMTMMDFFGPEDQKRILESMKRVLREGSSKVEAEMITKDGTAILYEFTGSILRDGHGNVVGFSGTGRDLTERKLMERRLERERENLSIILNISPVGILLMDSDGSVVKVNDVAAKLFGKTVAEMLNSQSGNAFGCIHSTEDPRGCGHGPACGACPIRASIEKVMRTGEPVRGLEIQMTVLVDGVEISPWVEMEIQAVNIDGQRHVIASLFNVTERKVAQQRIREQAEAAEAEKEAKAVELAVMSHEVRTAMTSLLCSTEMLMDDGVSTDEKRECLDVMCRNGKRLLGLVIEGESEDFLSAAQSGEDADDLPRLSGRILLAEDGPDNQLLISAFLRKAGAVVDLAANGREALDKVVSACSGNVRHDAIIMDLEMPEMDGYEATKLIRQAGYQGPILALSAHVRSEDRDKCIKAGCDSFASKPIDRRGLLIALKALLDKPRTSGSQIAEV